MFAKLLKYEFRAHGPLFGVASAALLGLGVLGGLVTRWAESVPESPAWNTVSTLLVPGIFLLMLAPIVFIIGNMVLLLVRFYKNKFTDEGYLTFTLPVNSHQLFLSSALSYLAWSVAGYLVLALYILVFVMVSGLPELLLQSAEGFGMILTALTGALLNAELYGSYFWLYGLSILADLICSCIVPLACITVGCTIAKRHKVLASFGIYYGYSLLSGYLVTVITAIISITGLGMLWEGDFSQYFWVLTAVEIAATLIPAAGAYILATYLMKRDLNLA